MNAIRIAGDTVSMHTGFEPRLLLPCFGSTECLIRFEMIHVFEMLISSSGSKTAEK